LWTKGPLKAVLLAQIDHRMPPGPLFCWMERQSWVPPVSERKNFAQLPARSHGFRLHERERSRGNRSFASDSAIDLSPAAESVEGCLKGRRPVISSSDHFMCAAACCAHATWGEPELESLVLLRSSAHRLRLSQPGAHNIHTVVPAIGGLATPAVETAARLGFSSLNPAHRQVLEKRLRSLGRQKVQSIGHLKQHANTQS
jgi:hypothetical protein